MVQYCFTSTETRRLVRTASPGRPPRLPHSSRTMSSAKCTRVIYVLTYRHIVWYDQKQRVGGAEPDSLRSVESQVKHDRGWSPQWTGDRYRQLVPGRGNLAGKRKSVDHVPLVLYDWSVESCRPTTGHVRLVESCRPTTGHVRLVESCRPTTGHVRLVSRVV